MQSVRSRFVTPCQERFPCLDVSRHLHISISLAGISISGGDRETAARRPDRDMQLKERPGGGDPGDRETGGRPD